MTEAQNPVEAADVLKRISAILDSAHELQAQGRKSPDLCDAYRQAAERFQEAAHLSRDILLTKHAFPKRNQLEIFCPYYFYEAERSLSSWYYEKRDPEHARSHLLKAAEYADEYIKGMEAHLSTAEASFVPRLTSCLTTAKFFRDNDNLALRSIDARAAWDRGDFVSALDEYRRMGQQSEALIEQTRTLNDASYYRITLGNYLSTFGNASSALAMHIAKSNGVPGVFPHDLACKLIRYTMDAYRAGLAGADANPEWSQYREHALLCQQNVASLLIDNKSRWAELYSELNDDADFIKLMARLDLPTLRSLQGGGASVTVSHSALAREDLIKRITLALSTLRAYVESINRLRLFDINTISEDFFARFLSEVFGLSLANLNVGTTTQAAIDLGDTDAKECIQVTSDGSKAKVQKTLQTFRKHNLHTEYRRLRIVVIGNRVGKYAGLESAIDPVFDPNAHVLGIPELIQSLAELDTSNLRRLVQIIDHEMPAINSTPLPSVQLKNTDVRGGQGGVGPGGDARVKGPKGGDISIVGGTIRGGDDGEGGGKGGDAIIEGGDG